MIFNLPTVKNVVKFQLHLPNIANGSFHVLCPHLFFAQLAQFWSFCLERHHFFLTYAGT